MGTARVTKNKPLVKIRRIIGGQVYDTETASVIYRYDSATEPHYEEHWLDYECVLFQNLWGHYFSYYIDENYEGQETITVHPDQASVIKWMERHCFWLIEDHFGKLHEAGEGPPYTPKQES